MTAKGDETGGFSLRRWSQRKLQRARAERQDPAPAPVPAPDAAVAQARAASRPGNALAGEIPDAAPTGAQLPPIDSLTIDSDFTPFFQPQVDDATKRAALKQLFRDPRFNVMDGLDTYIADYSLPDPVPAAMLEDLMQRRGFLALSTGTTEPAALGDHTRTPNAEPPSIRAEPAALPARLAETVPPKPRVSPMQAAGSPPRDAMECADAAPDADDPAAPASTETRTGTRTDTGSDPT